MAFIIPFLLSSWGDFFWSALERYCFVFCQKVA